MRHGDVINKFTTRIAETTDKMFNFRYRKLAISTVFVIATAYHLSFNNNLVSNIFNSTYSNPVGGLQEVIQLPPTRAGVDTRDFSKPVPLPPTQAGVDVNTGTPIPLPPTQAGVDVDTGTPVPLPPTRVGG